MGNDECDVWTAGYCARREEVDQCPCGVEHELEHWVWKFGEECDWSVAVAVLSDVFAARCSWVDEYFCFDAVELSENSIE